MLPVARASLTRIEIDVAAAQLQSQAAERLD